MRKQQALGKKLRMNLRRIRDKGETDANIKNGKIVKWKETSGEGGDFVATAGSDIRMNVISDEKSAHIDMNIVVENWPAPALKCSLLSARDLISKIDNLKTHV